MTPGARVSAAIEILDAWQAGAPVEVLLTRWARGARYAGSRDRAAVRDIVYDILRRRNSAAMLGGGNDGRSLAIGWLRGQDRPVGEIFTGEGHAPAILTPAEEARLAGAAPDPAPDTDVPDWLRAPLAAAGMAEAPLLAAMADRAPLWLRVALRRGSVAAAAGALAREGVATRPADTCATALEVTENARRLRNTGAYRGGLVEIQDLSAQRAVAGVDWPQAGAILDYCAGGGGKALAIADLSEATVFAHDIDPRRMRDLPGRADRARVSIPVLAPGETGRHAPYAAVLCDVPCSGSGTWRRDPEAKWRLTPERLAELHRQQAAILDDAAALVGTGGRLVYMTCSLLRSENEDQIDAFLARREGQWICEGMRTDTPLTASDGFFSAVLGRAG